MCVCTAHTPETYHAAPRRSGERSDSPCLTTRDSCVLRQVCHALMGDTKVRRISVIPVSESRGVRRSASFLAQPPGHQRRPSSHLSLPLAEGSGKEEWSGREARHQFRSDTILRSLAKCGEAQMVEKLKCLVSLISVALLSPTA